MRFVLCLMFGFILHSVYLLHPAPSLFISVLCSSLRCVAKIKSSDRHSGKGSHGKPFTCPTSSFITVFPFVLLFVRLMNDERWWSFLRRTTGMLKCSLGSFSHPKTSARRVRWCFVDVKTKTHENDRVFSFQFASLIVNFNLKSIYVQIGDWSLLKHSC